MSINENVYGAADTWLNAPNLSTGAMKAKIANFTGGSTAAAAILSAGNTAGKTPHNALIDRSISMTALGNESIYSHITYMHGTEIYTDDVIATEFYFCINIGDSFVTDFDIETNTPQNYWKTYYQGTYNASDTTAPIVELNPKKILYLLQVRPVNAMGEPAPFISGVVDNARFMFIGDYVNNSNNIKTQYPYIQAARLSPRVDNSSSSTPSRSNPFTSTSGFGIAINREFSAIPDSNIKINYAQFRNNVSYDLNNIPLWGHIGYIHTSYDYNIILASPDDIQTGVIEYSREYWIAHEWDNDFYDYLVRQAACFGVYVKAFSGEGSAASLPLTNDSVILGLLDDQGIGHGDYTRGADNVNNPIYNWTSYSQSPYDWTKPVDPTPYNKQTVFGSNGLINTFIQYWALSPAALTGLCDKIYDYIDGLDPDTVDINQSIAKTFYTNNPLDVIVSLKRLPFDITQYSSITGTAQPVKLGNLSLFDITGYKLNGQYTVVDFGSYHVYPKFGNTFLDYAPYTYFELIIPFCGSTRIDPALFMDKTLKLKMVVDLYTGACTCYILADNLCIDSISGNCAIDIPVSGIQSADFQNSVQNAITNVKNARINSKAFEQRGNLAVGSMGRKIFGNSAVNVGNVLSNMGTSLSSALSLHSNITSVQQQEAQNAIDVNQAEYNLQHVQTPFNSVGSQSAANSYVEEMQARLIIYRPKFAEGYDAAKYAKTIGHACLINGKVSDFSGLTVGNINTDGILLHGMSPTDTEKTMLKSLFAGGVIL